jgi:hypothetical protein
MLHAVLLDCHDIVLRHHYKKFTNTLQDVYLRCVHLLSAVNDAIVFALANLQCTAQ